MNCRICLDESNDMIGVFTDEGNAMQIADIISQHFWFQFHQDDNLSKTICRNCWSIIHHFHLFFSEIEKRQLCLEKVIQEETSIGYAEEIVDLSSPEVMVLTKDDGSDEEDQTQYAFNYADQFVVTNEPVDIQDEITIDSSADEYENEEEAIRNHCDMKCDLCSSLEVRFNTFAEATAHYESVHSMLGYVVCCSKLFFQKQEALDHISSAHSQLEVFRCDQCSKCFRDKEIMEKHIEEHTNSEESSYKDPLSNDDILYIQTVS